MDTTLESQPNHLIDLSAQNKAHWINKKRVLLELEAQFRAECDGLEDIQRYLYVASRD